MGVDNAASDRKRLHGGKDDERKLTWEKMGWLVGSGSGPGRFRRAIDGTAESIRLL